jgi:hypothetical protein
LPAPPPAPPPSSPPSSPPASAIVFARFATFFGADQRFFCGAEPSDEICSPDDANVESVDAEPSSTTSYVNWLMSSSLHSKFFSFFLPWRAGGEHVEHAPPRRRADSRARRRAPPRRVEWGPGGGETA